MLLACAAGAWALVARNGGGNDGRVTWKVDQAPFALHADLIEAIVEVGVRARSSS